MNIFWNAVPSFTEADHGADRYAVRGAEDGIRVRITAEQFLGSLIAGLNTKAGYNHRFRRNSDSSLAHGVEKSRFAVVSRCLIQFSYPDVSDPFSGSGQNLRLLLCGFVIIKIDTRACAAVLSENNYGERILPEDVVMLLC